MLINLSGFDMRLKKIIMEKCVGTLYICNVYIRLVAHNPIYNMLNRTPHIARA